MSRTRNRAKNRGFAERDRWKGSGPLRKQFSARVKDVGQRTLRFTISTNSLDRDGDTINPEGWDLSNYASNPVVLWAHDYRALPVARAMKVWATGTRLMADAKFAEPELYPFADTVYRMYKEGFLSAVSVGFLPKKWAFAEGDDRYGVDFQEQELLEFSCTPVPSNPEALVAASAAGIDTRAIKGWAREVLYRSGSSTTYDPDVLDPILGTTPKTGVLDEMLGLSSPTDALDDILGTGYDPDALDDILGTAPTRTSTRTANRRRSRC